MNILEYKNAYNTLLDEKAIISSKIRTIKDSRTRALTSVKVGDIVKIRYRDWGTGYTDKNGNWRSTISYKTQKACVQSIILNRSGLSVRYTFYKLDNKGIPTLDMVNEWGVQLEED